MKIIADVGGTRGRWVFINKSSKKIIETRGFNPYIHSRSILDKIIKEFNNYFDFDIFKEVKYYGAGINNYHTEKIVIDTLKESLKDADIEVFSDLLGSCQSLCNNKTGIVSVLGTGSNSCLYNGKKIINQINSLGYLIGDEGSAYSLGKMFIKMHLRGELSTEISEYFDRINKDDKNYLSKIYDKNSYQWIAGLSKFIYDNKEEKSLKKMIRYHFDRYFDEIIVKYNYHKLYLTGSISYFFEKEIREVSKSHGIEIKKVIRDPIDHLVKYHVK